MERKKNSGGRESNYDLLRIVATVAVIMIHVSATYASAAANPMIFGELYSSHNLTTIFYNTISRFAVPCFVMLSGAFILADDKTADYKYFYKKSFANIGIHMIIFSVLYFLYSLLDLLPDIIFRGGEWTALLTSVKSLISGQPFYHLWYLYMLIGIYLLAPVAVRFKNSVSEKSFSRTAWIFLIIACLSEGTSTHLFMWDIGSSFCYLGYFLIGYELRRLTCQKKSNLKGIGFIFLGILIEFVFICIQYERTIRGVAGLDVGPWGAFIVAASILIFAGFSYLSIKKDFSGLSSHTFVIYLLHAGVWDLFIRIIRSRMGANSDNRIVIPISILLVFLVSYIGAVCYRRIWKQNLQKS